MDIVVDKLVEIVKYNNEAIYDYWILISYRESLWKGETFKEAILINIEKKNYHRSNILDQDNFRVKVEIEELRTINFPLGSILNKEGQLLFTPYECSKSEYVYDYEIFINTKKNSLHSLQSIDLIGIDFIQGIPCYLLNSSGIEFLLPVHVFLDFFFYINTDVTNILVNNFDSVKSLYKRDNTLFYSSTIIKQDSIEKLAPYFFTIADSGIEALMKINEHKSDWLNQRKNNVDCKAFIKTNFPFNYALLNVKGMFLTDYNRELEGSRYFLVLAIENIRPFGDQKSFFNTNEIILKDLTDKRSSDFRDEKDVIENNTIMLIDKQIENEGIKLTKDEVNNSLPELESNSIRTKKINFDINYRKLNKEDQEFKYVTNNYVVINSNSTSTNYNEQNSNCNTSKFLAKEEENSFSFFKVFFRAMDIMKSKGYQIKYLMLKEIVNSQITIAPSGLKINKKLNRLKVSICQIEIRGNNYVLIEAEENYYIGMFKSVNNTKFDAHNDTRLFSFLEKVINVHKYNWSRVNSLENNRYQMNDGIKIFMPIEHPKKKAVTLLSENKNSEIIIDLLAMELFDKILNRVKSDF